MEWTPGGSDQDIEDRRDDSGGGPGFGGFGGVHLGIGGVIVVGVLSLVFHQNFFALLSGSGSGTGSGVAPSGAMHAPDTQSDQQEKPEYEFVKFVLNDVQINWDTTLQAQTGIPYHHAKLVLYRDAFPSACGEAQTAVGPFYCPGDEKVYLDLGFFNELAQRFGAPGKFAQAYVIAHEIGHHVQKLRGIEGKVRQLQEGNPGEQNPLSVRLELQADCYAGVWGFSTEQRGIINDADITQGLNAAAAVGDDRLQRMAGRAVSPDSFTHGSSAQRVGWFKRGMARGKLSDCNTFGNSLN